ncbi:armadillo-type protein [Usnea florida]
MTSGENQKMTRSASFKSFVGKEKEKLFQREGETEKGNNMKPSKSSTSIAALLSRPRLSKGVKSEDARGQKDKENQRPPSSAEMPPPPIWAQFATQGFEESPHTTKIPLHDRFLLEEEVALYTPQDYSPSKQRNFPNYQQPTLPRTTEAKPRPKSECIAAGPSPTSFAETSSSMRKSGLNKSQVDVSNQTRAKKAVEAGQNCLPEEKHLSDKLPKVENRKVSNDSAGSNLPMPKHGSRVMAAVAAFNGKAKELPKAPPSETENVQLDPKTIESAFESLLEARNVPQNTRDKMRSLDTNIKADFIKKDKSGSGSASSTEGLLLQSSRPGTGKRSQTDDVTTHETEKVVGPVVSNESPKKPRPRSRTFTFSKSGQSPSKKQKSERPVSHQRNKSGGLTPSASSTSLVSDGGAQGSTYFGRANKPAVPEDYIEYLRTVQAPESVEVGKIHKLRQLLRNETVGWIDTFIIQGGMTELVELLYRIIKVEWRSEHEDNLLHEALLCLKALSTTSSAMRQLSSIQSTLFPTLLGMLFDEEKKGPSEYTTRSIIITILYTYLADSPSSDLAGRARLLLSYLRDPSKPEESQPPGFITSIYHSRPYRVWQREMSNVTKEVFWIFLHHTNIIPYPNISEASNSYASRHFTREHPPVPAAPYIGGVEWDATTYLTSHIDLLNGIMASLPTCQERNQLRQELKDSGFERVMGVQLRTCKEKFYSCVHEALSTWVGAAVEDGWPYQDVRQGPKLEDVRKSSPVKSPRKKDAGAPRLEMPKLELGAGGKSGGGGDDGGWL